MYQLWNQTFFLVPNLKIFRLMLPYFFRVKVSKNRNDFMKTPYVQKCNAIIYMISAFTLKGQKSIKQLCWFLGETILTFSKTHIFKTRILGADWLGEYKKDSKTVLWWIHTCFLITALFLRRAPDGHILVICTAILVILSSRPSVLVSIMFWVTAIILG